MKRRLYLGLLAVAVLFVGCEKETVPVEPELPGLSDGTIPVIFHVLYEDSTDPEQNPSASVFQQRIDQLNRFYAATLFPDAGSSAVDVKFVLATHDPTGAALSVPGVDRTRYTGAANMSADRFLDVDRTLTVRDREILWDPNQYVNVWLFGFLDSSDPNQDESDVTGVSYLPYCTSAHPLTMLVPWDGAITAAPYYMHGIALNNHYFQNDEGMFTLCHEMGHYLGLKHAFSETDGCTDPDDASDDGCSDTPKYDRATYQRAFYDNYLYGKPMPYDGTAYERQSCSGRVFTSTNVMDYFQSYRTNLTPQQKARIEHVLAYSPWIPRSKTATKALLENFTGEITDERPRPVLMY
ncbi:MAG: hypothetical protein K2G93_08395 [Rikenella sp.]|nr:hypothetical protein [Rikenella sp.]